MARYKPYNVKQDKFIAVSCAEQIVPGSFEYALNEIIEEHLDLTVFQRRYRNDETGRVTRQRHEPHDVGIVEAQPVVPAHRPLLDAAGKPHAAVLTLRDLRLGQIERQRHLAQAF